MTSHICLGLLSLCHGAKWIWGLKERGQVFQPELEVSGDWSWKQLSVSYAGVQGQGEVGRYSVLNLHLFFF